MSTYNGGSNDDAGYSIQLNSQNQPLITGGTMSNDFLLLQLQIQHTVVILMVL